jgi:hypothetical protein
MSKECKTARNVVATTFVLMMLLVSILSSCASNHSACAAYASVEKIK